MGHAIYYNESSILEILPKISQWESIPYVLDYTCQECGKSAIGGGIDGGRVKPNLIGWCDTPNGYMAIFECPVCFSKFRFHPHVDSFSKDRFISTLEVYYVGDENVSEFCLCGNALELYKRCKEKEN